MADLLIVRSASLQDLLLAYSIEQPHLEMNLQQWLKK